MGGEGIVLKERTSLYRPGIRSPTWLKVKPTLTRRRRHGRIYGPHPRGDWGEAVMLAFRYTHPRTGADVEIRQAGACRGIGRSTSDRRAVELVCWGVMPSGMLRHPAACLALKE